MRSTIFTEVIGETITKTSGRKEDSNKAVDLAIIKKEVINRIEALERRDG